jgi:Big-like domain-containing protein
VATTLGTATLNGSGQAMLTVPSLSPGSHSIAGQYSGDSNFGSSSSAGSGGGGGFTQTVNRAMTTTAIISSANYSILNQSVTFTAHVSVVAPGSGTPTGSVAFQDGSTVLGTVALSTSGSATFTTSSLAVNAHSITAAYSGDSNFSGSASPALNQLVQYEPVGTTCDGAPGHQILQPINADGTSVFKVGRPVPAMFRVCDFLGNSVGTPGVVQSFLLAQIINGTVTQTVDDNVDSMTPDTAFRWDPTNLQWIFNIATKSLSTNKTYVYAITLNDGTMIGFQFGLK